MSRCRITTPLFILASESKQRLENRKLVELHKFKNCTEIDQKLRLSMLLLFLVMQMIPVTQDVLSNILCMDNISYKEQEAEQLCAHKRLMSTFTSLTAVCSSVPGLQAFSHSGEKVCLVLRGCGRHCGWPHASALLGDFAKTPIVDKAYSPISLGFREFFLLRACTDLAEEPSLVASTRIGWLTAACNSSSRDLKASPDPFRQLFSLAHTHMHKLKTCFLKKQKSYISSESNSIISSCFSLFLNLFPSPQKAQGQGRR